MSKPFLHLKRIFGGNATARAVSPANEWPNIKLIHQEGEGAPQMMDMKYDAGSYFVGLSEDGRQWRYHQPTFIGTAPTSPFDDYSAWSDVNGNVSCFCNFNGIWRSDDYGRTYARVYLGSSFTETNLIGRNARNVRCEPNFLWHLDGDVWFAVGYGDQANNGDPLFADVSTLLQFDEAVGTTTATDTTGLVTWQTIGNYIMAASGYYGSGGAFDGASALRTTDISGFNFGSGDFVIEGVVQTTLPASVNTIMSQRSSADANNYWSLDITAAGKLRFVAVSAGVSVVDVTTVASLALISSNWRGFSVQRIGGVTEIRFNSVIQTLTGTDTGSPMPTLAHDVYIGYGDETGVTPLVGQLKHFRVTTVARYTLGASGGSSSAFPVSYYPDSISEWIRSDDNGLTWEPYSPVGLPTILEEISTGRPMYAPHINEMDATFVVGCSIGDGAFVFGSVFDPPKFLADSVTLAGWDVANYHYCMYLTLDYGLTWEQIKDTHEGSAMDVPMDHTNLEGWPAMIKLPDGRLVSVSLDEYGDRGNGSFVGKVYTSTDNWRTFQRGPIYNPPEQNSSVWELDTAAITTARHTLGPASGGNLFPTRAALAKHTESAPLSLDAIFGGADTSYRDAVIAAAPVLYYRFNEATGATTLVDQMGTYSISVPPTQGLISAGYPGAIFGDSDSTICLRADGEPLVVPNAASLAIKSIEFWYNWSADTARTSGAQTMPLLSRGKSWQIKAGSLYGGAGATSADTLSISTGTTGHVNGWKHIVFVLGASTTTAYVDGAFAGSIAQPLANFNTGEELRLMAGYHAIADNDDYSSASFNYAGPGSELAYAIPFYRPHVCSAPVYDELSIYTRELTSGEILARYTLGIGD
jgi:hypothetical protein